MFSSFKSAAMIYLCFCTCVLILAVVANGENTAIPSTPRQRQQRREEAIAALKRDIHKLSAAEIRERFRSVTPGMGDPPPPHQGKVDHFVVLLMENHSFDNVLGCMKDTHPNGDQIDGIPRSGRLVPKDPSGDLTKGYVYVTCGTGDYVCKGGPGYNAFSAKFKKGTNCNAYPYAAQSDLFSYPNGMSNPVTRSMFSPEQLPVKTALANAYGIFNKFYTAVPSWSQPNHLFAQSATSCGVIDNIIYSQCGGSTDTYPQFTIYDSMFTNNVSFALYMNSTCGIDGNKPCHGTGPHGTPPIPTPDVAMQGVGRHKDRFMSQKLFYEAAANGTLPSFSWLMPPIEACDHPCNDMAKGERILKDVYEALRNGPKWNRTLFLAVYDDCGGYYDHVVPPFEGVPSDDAPCRCPTTRFDFRRLGLRTTAILMSPWVKKASVFQEPEGPTNTSQFELSSVPATVKNLFNLSGFLTKRDMWAGSFDELLMDTPRAEDDMPIHLPDAPLPAKPWGPPPNVSFNVDSVYDDDDDDDDDDDASPQPQHCGHVEQVCRGVGTVTTKHKNLMKTFAALMKTTPPVLDGADRSGTAKANEWLAQHWIEYMSTDGGIDKPTFSRIAEEL